MTDTDKIREVINQVPPPTVRTPVVITEDHNLFFDNRANTDPPVCEGCGRLWETDRVAVITDRSGSEQAIAHVKADCIHRAIVRTTP